MTYNLWEQTVEIEYGEIVEATRPLLQGTLTDDEIEAKGYDIFDEIELHEYLDSYTGEIVLLSLIDDVDEEVGFIVLEANK